MKNQGLNELRRQAQKLRSSATAKITRNQRVKGVMLSGTKYDPRRDPKAINRYTKRQLESYINQLSQFNSRTTQFVGDRAGRPIPREKWAPVARKQRQANKKVNTIFEQFADIKLRRGDETIRERMDKMTPKHRRMGNFVVNAPYAPPTLQPFNLDNEKSLRKLNAKMDRRLSGDYIKKELRHSRRSARKMLQAGGNHKLWDEVKDLTDAQFYALWNFTQFAADVALNYETSGESTSEGELEPWYLEPARTAIEEATKDVKWAKKIRVRL